MDCRRSRSREIGEELTGNGQIAFDFAACICRSTAQIDGGRIGLEAEACAFGDIEPRRERCALTECQIGTRRQMRKRAEAEACTVSKDVAAIFAGGLEEERSGSSDVLFAERGERERAGAIVAESKTGSSVRGKRNRIRHRLEGRCVHDQAAALDFNVTRKRIVVAVNRTDVRLRIGNHERTVAAEFIQRGFDHLRIFQGTEDTDLAGIAQRSVRLDDELGARINTDGTGEVAVEFFRRLSTVDVFNEHGSCDDVDIAGARKCREAARLAREADFERAVALNFDNAGGRVALEGSSLQRTFFDE